MEATAGLEPATCGVETRCSNPVELCGRKGGRRLITPAGLALVEEATNAKLLWPRQKFRLAYAY